MVNEKRLIDAYALVKAIKSFRWVGVPNTLKLMFDYLKIIIRDQPTVDAVEVVHGSWAFIAEDCCVCSVCHKHSIVDYHYCPECGAKMDLKGERNERQLL